jgi:hypothetical protein
MFNHLLLKNCRLRIISPKFFDEDLYLIQSINIASNGVVNNKPTVSDGHIVESTGQTGVLENAPIAEPVVKPKRQYNKRKPLNKYFMIHNMTYVLK